MSGADVVIVGGGPVGLATAIAARLHGLSALVLERGHEPVEKACGEGILPAGRAALARLGVDLPTGRPFRGIRYRSDGTVAEADFPDGLTGRGVRRVDLHRALAGRARDVGAELRFGTVVASVGEEEHGVAAETAAGESLRGRFLVGADGLHSQVRRALGLEAKERAAAHELRYGVTRHFSGAPVLERVEVVFGDRAEAYLTPLGDAHGSEGSDAAEEIGVAILWSGGKGGFDTLVAERFPPSFAARLAGLARLGRDRGAGPFRQRVRARVRGRAALVGDAGGYVDALTGEGMSLGFEQAEALAAAMAAGGLAPYGRAARALASTPERLTRWALRFAARPALRRRYVAALERDPALFTAFLGALGARRPLPAGRALALLARLALPPSRAAAS